MTTVMQKTDAALSAVIQSHSFISSLTYFESISSTNAYALDACQAGKLEAGALVIADHQQAGKGRFQNSWESKPGEDLLLSLVMKPVCDPIHWPKISFPLALALREAMALYVPPHVLVELKWPNDILVGGKKCLGMLSSADAQQGHVVMGIGLNVNQRSSELDRTSLGHAMPLNRWEVLGDVLTAIGRYWDDILSANVSIEKWNNHAAYIGQSVQVMDQSLIEGVFMGINADGAAIINTVSGDVPVVNGRDFRPI